MKIRVARHLRPSKTLALLSGLCLAACASSNYAPVVYHQDGGATGGASVISEGDPAAAASSESAPPPSAGAGVTPVQAQALGSTPTSPPSQYDQPIEAEQPHGLAMRGQAATSAANAPMEIETRPTVIAQDAPVPVGLEEPYRVTVQPGDTVSSLSRAHSVEKSKIIAANNLQPPYGLKVGETLVIPKGATITGATASAGGATTAQVHVVKPGETLYSIARNQHADIRAIALANNISPPYRLKVGESLKLPGTAAPVAEAEGGPLLHLGQSPMPPAGAASASPPDQAADADATSKSPFIWPVSGRIISTFGPKEAGRRNDGLNIAAPVGTPVRAARSGEVIYAGNELRGYGNLVLIRHDDGYVTAYAHNSSILVQRGAHVRQGQEIAESGESGAVTEPQVHFEIRKDKKPVDPMDLLPKVSA